MGKSETTSVSIGLQITLSTLVEQITKSNYNFIIEFLRKGFIEDENSYFNEVYSTVLYQIFDEPEIDISLIEEKKNELIYEFKNNGTLYKEKFSNNVTKDLSDGCLYDQQLLIPCQVILCTDRWGYDRYGTNGNMCDLDLNMLSTMRNKIDEKYKNMINGYKIVLILKQCSG